MHCEVSVIRFMTFLMANFVESNDISLTVSEKVSNNVPAFRFSTNALRIGDVA